MAKDPPSSKLHRFLFLTFLYPSSCTMNSTTAYADPKLPVVTCQCSVMDRDVAIVYTSVVAVVATILIQIFISRNFRYIRKIVANTAATAIKLIFFLSLGQLPVRHSGFLSYLSYADVVGVAGFGGLGLSIFYVFHDRFLPSYGPNVLTTAGYNDHHNKVKLDRALQEKLTLLLVWEIYHTVFGVMIGVVVMRLLRLCAIDHKHLDLLMTIGVFGPALFFLFFISGTGIGLGGCWCLRRFRNWWHG
ncbi:hypothetical protein P691DRAFT_763375 [Macrolepiota fuliginosa MF-IS2]|uniref:Uncharacterized protein n=1 Tax=Macrolepiota fuliginosa MF-IS2 TaxID=1400762 RepID=A0A9P5X6V5_9AGAR|nr:hypothetical protein P691DRAFT_763375 [Macrolepiota fuliginosa MF-IS2]